MIQVLLLILKIIGITVLAVLGAVLLVLAVVLFVPIFYRVRIIHNPEKTQVKARVSFLFPMVIASVEYLKKLSFKVRIFGIPLLDSEKTEKEKKPAKKKSRKQRKKHRKDKQSEPETEEPTEESTATSTHVPPKEQKQEQLTVSELPEEKEEPKAEKTEKKSFFDKVRSKIKKIRETISNIVNKIKRLFRQKEEAKQILAKQETKAALNFAWDKLKHLLKHIFPRKIKGYVAYGADNPATTGQVLGILSVIYARCGQLLTIRPNFTEKQLESDVELRGRIQVFTLLVIAVKVFLNQELKQLLAEVKGIKEIE